MAEVHSAERPKTAGERQRAEQRGRHDAQGAKGPTDARLAMEINARLTHHPELDAQAIEVVVDQGTVSLLGHVCDEASKQVAQTLACSVVGVVEVNNRLTVGG